MLSSSQYRLLEQARDNQLPREIDATCGLSISDLRMLIDLGLIDAVDVSADCGDGYLYPRITGVGVLFLNARAG
ncbi:hypothetical protein SNE35_09780 [Paucibacter sp. R3-3]|uniref:DprA winged helix domain-containing protein n=1 Tax=Roseateles agri TaxID=3098619 RepID=A0ABU5DGC1_9BURK|nr:hypothetical protein [Paucibacter sp. R3-3]MDY0744798.1 hypothetical protein [Paucibacter sp. R3-3]